MTDEARFRLHTPGPAAKQEVTESIANGETFDMAKAVAFVKANLPRPPVKTARPVLVMLSGLPGTGKSYLARRLAERERFVVLESDRVRKLLFPQPGYDSRESHLVHLTIHHLLRDLISWGAWVIYDATNLSEFHREAIYNIADRLGAKLIIVRTTAPPQVVQTRLARRAEVRSPGDLSDATWEVYQAMQRQEQPVGRGHLVVDTSGDLDTAIRKIARLARS